MNDDMQQRLIEELEKNPELLKKLPSGSISLTEADRLLTAGRIEDFISNPVLVPILEAVNPATKPAIDNEDVAKVFENPEWDHKRMVLRLKKDDLIIIPVPGKKIEDCGVFYPSRVLGRPIESDLNVERFERKMPNRTLLTGQYKFDSGTYQFSSYDVGRQVCICYREVKEGFDPQNSLNNAVVIQGPAQIAQGTFQIPVIYPYSISVDPQRFIGDLGVRGQDGSVFVKWMDAPKYLDGYSASRDGTYIFHPSAAGKFVNITYQIRTNESSVAVQREFDQRERAFSEQKRVTASFASIWEQFEFSPPKTIEEKRRKLNQLEQFKYNRGLSPLNIQEIEKLKQKIEEQTQELESAERAKRKLVEAKQKEQAKIQYERNQRAAKVREQIRLLEEQEKRIKRGEVVEELEIKPKEVETPSLPTDPRRRKIILE